MVKNTLTLERADIVWIDFSPTKGHEQSGLRPAIVLSTSNFNSISGMVLVCPMTSKYKDYFFTVPIEGPKEKSFALTDQLRTFDIGERVLKKTGKISESEINEILARASTLFQ